MKKSVVILGGGLTGLSAAWQLTKYGIKVSVIEKEHYTGGLSASIEKDGFIFDFGPHRFHTHDNKILEMVDSLVGHRLRKLTKSTKIWFMKKYFDYPLKAKDVFLNISLMLSLSCFFDYLFVRLKNKFKPMQDTSFETWVINRFGKSIYNFYFGPYTEKTWGRPPSMLSSSYAEQRIPAMNLLDVIKRSFITKFKKDNHPHSPYDSKFYYPYKGIGEIAHFLEKGILEHGGKIYTDSNVRKVTINNKKVQSVTFSGATGEKVIECDYLISTIALPDFIKVVVPDVDAPLLSAANNLSYRSIVFLNLIIDRPFVTSHHWIYIPPKNILFNRLSEIKNFSVDTIKDGMTSLCLEIPCDKGDLIWNSKPEDLYEKVVLQLEEIGLVSKEDIRNYFISRTEYGYPIYDITHAVKLEKLMKYVDQLDNLIVAGRQGLFKYINMDHAIKMGILSADVIMGYAKKEEVAQVCAWKGYYG